VLRRLSSHLPGEFHVLILALGCGIHAADERATTKLFSSSSDTREDAGADLSSLPITLLVVLPSGISNSVSSIPRSQQQEPTTRLWEETRGTYPSEELELPSLEDAARRVVLARPVSWEKF